MIPIALGIRLLFKNQRNNIVYIIGWRTGAKTIDAINAIRKHTGISLTESKQLIEDVLAGNSRKLPNDFVLREDLEACKFIIQ